MGLFKDAFAVKRGFYEGGKLNGPNQDFRNGNAPFEETASPDRDTMRVHDGYMKTTASSQE